MWRATGGRLRGMLPAIVALLVIAAYAVLLPAGKWQGDDYLGAWFVASDGWHVLSDRLTGRSPRPIAETLTWLYFSLSNALDRPLIGAFLAVLWAASLAIVAVAGRVGGVSRPVVLALLLFAVTLLLIKPGEMFYWPMGAVAYLPCWAGLAATTVLLRVDVDRHRVALTFALLIAVLSVEVGAITVLFYAALLGVADLRDGRLHRVRSLMLPAFCGAVVCLIVLRGRMLPAGEVWDAGSGLAGNWTASLRAALPTFAREAAGIAGLPLLAGAAIKLLLLLCLPPDGGGGRSAGGAVLWAIALLLGAFASIVLAYHQFGALCCERHATLRQGMVLMALFALAGLLGGGFLAVRQIGLVALLLVLLGVRAAPLSAEWRGLGDVFAARQRSWASAAAPGDAMTLFLAPPAPITNADSLPPGQYRRTTDQPFGDTPWYAWGVMARFDKHILVIEPAGR
jgi:hypothetical protein